VLPHEKRFLLFPLFFDGSLKDFFSNPRAVTEPAALLGQGEEMKIAGSPLLFPSRYVRCPKLLLLLPSQPFYDVEPFFYGLLNFLPITSDPPPPRQRKD